MVEMDGAVGVGGGGQAPAPPRLWRLVDERSDLRAMESDYVRRFHRHEPRDHQCSSAVAKHIKAPVHLNYSSILTIHPEVIDGRPGTLVIESFVVDVPDGNTKDETCYFVEALLKCNLKSLAEVSENRVTGDQTEPLDR
ncbi:unnamed protein product [Urochloa humidicola]